VKSTTSTEFSINLPGYSGKVTITAEADIDILKWGCFVAKAQTDPETAIREVLADNPGMEDSINSILAAFPGTETSVEDIIKCYISGKAYPEVADPAEEISLG
jgi:hypothetical protein